MAQFKPGDVVIHATDTLGCAPGILIERLYADTWLVYWFDADGTDHHRSFYLKQLAERK